MITEAQLSDLPGGEEILKGLEDLSCGTLSIEACLAECCSPKLIQYGLADVSQTGRIVEPELEMYRLLAETDGEEAFVRDIPEKRFEVSHPALAEKSVDDAKIDSLIKSLKSDSYHQALEELAERLDRGATLKDKSFRITTDGGKLVFTYSPAFVLKVYDHEEEVFSVKVLFRVSGISTTMSSLPRFEFFCRMSDLCRSPDVSESKYLQGINALYQLMLEWKVKGERHPFTNKSPSEPGTTFRLDLDKTVKSGFFSSFGSPKGLLASPKKVKKTQSANLPKKTSTGKFELLKATKSATALKKFSSNKKSLKDFEKDVDRYLPTFLGSIPSEKDMVAEMISEAIPGYQVYHSSPRKIGERYQRLLAREAERVLGYYPLSRELVRTVFNFCYAPPHDKRFNTMYSLSRSRLLKNGDFQSKILSKDIRIRMLGRCHYGHSQTTTMRMVCAKIFFHVYAGGFRDHHLMNAEDDQDMELISELQARRFLAMIPSRIHWYVYPYLEGMSVQGITAEFTNLFPNLNQTEEALDSSCSNGSGEDVDKNYSLTSRLAGKKPKIFATHNHDTFVLHHDYTFLFYRFGAKRPVGQLVFSHRVIHKLGQGKCLRFYKIQNLSFAKGIDLKIAEYIIGEIQHCALVQSTV